MRRFVAPAGALGIGWIALAAMPALAQQELLPNLQAKPAFDLSMQVDGLGRVLLRFSTRSINVGAGPLEVVGGEVTGERQNVYQRIYLDDGGFYERLAGEFVYHPTHNHFHLEDYALYTVQPVDAPGGSQRTSSKTSFCLIDTDRVDPTLPGAPGQAVYTSCSVGVQGISVGWGDTYGANLAGQWVDMTGQPSGDYRLSIDIDPRGRLREVIETDNASAVLLRIGMSALTVQVLDPAREVTVTGIEPDVVRAGTPTDVAIRGTGFAAGDAVTFAGGSGPAPAASNIVVESAELIRARVSTKKGGPRKGRVWDVHVGPGVLADGLTVLP